MGFYEIMFIIRPDLEAEDHEEIINGLKEAINVNQGRVDKVVDWRKRRLAYEIDDHVEGHYYLLYFSGSGDIIPEIEHFFRVNDNILRYMVVRVEEKDYETVVSEEDADQSEQAVSESEGGSAAQEASETVEEESGAESEQEASAETSTEETETE